MDQRNVLIPRYPLTDIEIYNSAVMYKIICLKK